MYILLYTLSEVLSNVDCYVKLNGIKFFDLSITCMRKKCDVISK